MAGLRSDIGLKQLVDVIQQLVIWPIASKLFPVEGEQLDSHHSFLVKYRADEDRGLDMHTDDADITFNVCLGHQFTGATLSFCGMIGTATHRKLSHTYNHEVGRAVLHLGSRRHGADDIAEGERVNLIVWSHNSKWRASDEYLRLGQHHGPHYAVESAPPDVVCLSFTHDRDFEKHRVPTDEEKQRRNQVTPWCPPRGKEYNKWA